MIKKDKLPAILGGNPAFIKPVPIARPTLPSIRKLNRKYELVLKSGLITNSKWVKEFETIMAGYLGVNHVVAVSSCTSGLMLAIKTLGLKGEVILPSFTFHSTVHAVIWNGLKPIFVDCDPESYNIDTKEVEKAITQNTSAIIGVHIFGNPSEVSALESISKRHKLKLIFDAAHGMGSKYKGTKVGRFGDAEVFSLSPTKLLTTGEGGIVTTNNKHLAEKIKIGRNYGDPGNYNSIFSGLNARMGEFNAILGIECLKTLEKNILNRNILAEYYMENLSKIPGLSFQKIHQGNRSSYKDFSIMINRAEFGVSRDRLYDAIIVENIMAKKYFFPPVHKQIAFYNYPPPKNRNFKNTLLVSQNSLCLPLFSHISRNSVKRICEALKRIYIFRGEINSEI